MTTASSLVFTKYLLRIGYIGTHYLGLQRQTPRNHDDPDTVQGVVESALQKCFRTRQPLTFFQSSRTDKGVNSDSCAGVVEWISKPSRTLEPYDVTAKLNRYFAKHRHDIICRETINVPLWFGTRSCAFRRQYTYNIALGDEDIRYSNIPVSQLPTRYFYRRKVDIEKVQEACEALSGFYDFSTFRAKNSDNRPTRMNLEEFTFLPDWNTVPPKTSSFYYWKFRIVAKSFLYKQVRRLVTAALTHGTGFTTMDQLKEMLHTPKDASVWKIPVVPSVGLVLDEVRYSEDQLNPDAPLPNWMSREMYDNYIAETFKQYEKKFQQVEKVTYTEHDGILFANEISN